MHVTELLRVVVRRSDDAIRSRELCGAGLVLVLALALRALAGLF